MNDELATTRTSLAPTATVGRRWRVVASTALLVLSGCASSVDTPNGGPSHDRRPSHSKAANELSKPVASHASRTHEARNHASDPDRCRRNQLKINYIAGGAENGQDFGALSIANASKRSCSLSGQLTVAPYGHQHRLHVRGQWVHAHVFKTAVVLAPRTAPGPARATGYRREEVVVGGSLLTPNGASTCPTTMRDHPAKWRLSGAINAQVTSFDPTASRYRRLGACTRHGTLILDNITVVAIR